jgi:hypothetical protein
MACDAEVAATSIRKEGLGGYEMVGGVPRNEVVNIVVRTSLDAIFTLDRLIRLED